MSLLAAARKASGSFSGGLTCVYCQGTAKVLHQPYDTSKQKWVLDKWITTTRVRYICAKCKRGTIYDFSARKGAYVNV